LEHKDTRLPEKRRDSEDYEQKHPRDKCARKGGSRQILGIFQPLTSAYARADVVFGALTAWSSAETVPRCRRFLRALVCAIAYALLRPFLPDNEEHHPLKGPYAPSDENRGDTARCKVAVQEHGNRVPISIEYEAEQCK